MTYDKLPGVYYSESVSAETTYSQEYTPLFIVQTSTAIPALDDKITEYTSFDAFKTIAENKGLTNTIKYIQDILIESGSSSFYVFSIKTDTAIGFTEAITNTAHLDDITEIIYVEETKSDDSNSIISKTTAIKNGVLDNAEYGSFRKAYIIPYGTVTDAVAQGASGTAEELALASLSAITEGQGNGRICMICPDSLAGSIVGKCIATKYNVDAGYTALSNLDLSNIYKFNHPQMLTLMNRGVMFAKPEKVQGTTQYRINMAVTTSFKESKGDGLLMCRTITDELLRRIGFGCQSFVKSKEGESGKADIEAITAAVIDEFAANEDIVRDETNLTVVDSGNMTYTLSGPIRPVRSVMAIEVITTLI